MTYHKYVVTAQKPTATQFAVKGSFTSSFETNLILGKGNRIEIYTLNPNGLKPTIEFSIYGTIIALELFKPKNQTQSWLLLITARHKYCILSYNASQQQIVTEGTGDIRFPGQLHNETSNVITALDPTCQYIATTLYESTVTLIIPEIAVQLPHKQQQQQQRKISLRLKEGKRRQVEIIQPHTQDYINISLFDKQIVSLAFLQDSTEPALLILYDDAREQRFLQLFEIKDRQLIPGNIVLDHFESDANLLIALPAGVGGAILVANQFIRYLKLDQPPIAIGIRPSTINSYTVMDETGTRVLLGDAEGLLYLLTLNSVANRVESLSFISLGKISIPSCLQYLDNDVVFVGSTVGDSQLIHIQRTASPEGGDILQVIEEFANLGPIADFCVADLDKQGQAQIITCSGAGKDSSLRVIRNGVGLNELAMIPVSGVQGIWALQSSFEKSHNLLLLSFFNQGRLLQLQSNNTIIQLDSYSAIDLDSKTIAAGNIKEAKMIQVTPRSVRLMDAHPSGSLRDEWIPDGTITVASINLTQCVVSLGYGILIALQVVNDTLQVIGETQFPYEISCIDIHPIQSATESAFVAIGTWNNVSVCLLKLPNLEVVAQESIGGTVMPRSILISQFENTNYLLVALGDGQFYNFKLDGREGTLSDKKRTFLGKWPIHLTTFTLNGITHVFAASDKPSVIHSRNQKLVYSNVNLKEVRCGTSFSCHSFPDAIALITKEGLVIGRMEEIQKLHVTKISTIDTPRRIAYQESSKSFGIITERISSAEYDASTVTGGFEVLDDQSLTVLDRVYFKQFERPLSLTTVVFENDPNEYYVVATGKDVDVFEHQSVGRILVLQYTSDRSPLRLVSQLKTEGMVDCVRAFEGKLLASVKGRLHVYRWERTLTGGQLVSISSKRLPSVTECITTHGDYIMTGDLVYSVVMFQFDRSTQQLVEVAAHEKVKEVLAIESIDENLMIGAEKDGHLFVLEHCQDEASADEPLLDMISGWHLGDMVSRFRFGSLGMNNVDPDSRPVAPSLIFGTSSGAIGIVADLSAERFKLLNQMQYNMTKAVKSIGGLSHAEWRNVNIMGRKEEATNFIDGDLIESFLDLSSYQMQSVVDGIHGGRKLDVTVEDLCKVVEELMSIHS
ncbi:hypothetical protein G6F70_004910 [Rhizopus microsporus]|uniref:DNA damage-binding protein 1 n=1 Tax=Rhizopus microsporus TaxID=58291 RepID=A0A1X0RR43_RHIZD|nr:hypothetical protein G6F71_004904 [Rhizopus microsporus]KAG1199466.1 hypothetical protein G6F70_004910 [Rhizopus microsporus]KAG1211289.1 hypothetical protein G6F69_004716 [Rhizopus microsporus]ORE14358.1 hypothetical protein BCV71DRAFT_293655 [Rhizopus microsporus]